MERKAVARARLKELIVILWILVFPSTNHDHEHGNPRAFFN